MLVILGIVRIYYLNLRYTVESLIGDSNSRKSGLMENTKYFQFYRFNLPLLRCKSEVKGTCKFIRVKETQTTP